MSKSEGKDWFDAKQETCHLYGILKYFLKENKTGKKVISRTLYTISDMKQKANSQGNSGKRQ